jgi:hypothetical protein
MPSARPGPLTRAVIIGGVVAGALDIIDAFAFSYAWRGVEPPRVLQAIASGLIGRAAFDGGASTALLGLLLHFFIACTVAAVYGVASLRLRVLVTHAIVMGLAYGIAVYFVMQYIVLPLSAFRGGAPAWPSIVNGILIHALGVGLPIALIVRWSRRARPPLAPPAST